MNFASEQIPIPSLSIVLPTYNREKYLPFSIESVLRQSFSDFELIIVDDGSTDGSEKLINSYQDSRIVYVRQKNLGEFAATNTGLRLARGFYVTWIHSDDVMPQESLFERINCLQKSNADLCHGDIATIDEHGNIVRYHQAIDADGKAAFLEYYKPWEVRAIRNPIHHTTVMFKRTLLQKTGLWDEHLACVGDIDWLLRALKYGQIVKAPGVLYFYRFHQNARRRLDAEKGLNYDNALKLILDKYR